MLRTMAPTLRRAAIFGFVATVTLGVMFGVMLGMMPVGPAAAQTNILADDALIVAVYENRVEKVRELLVRQHPKSR